MIPVPEVTNLDCAFGNIKHMPKYETLPEAFHHDREKHCDFVQRWFFGGLKPKDMELLKEKDGVNRGQALGAIRAILASFEPKHEHKISGAGYLLSQWFDLKETA